MAAAAVADPVPWPRSRLLLLLAATETAAVPGISAAGATPASRRGTAAADAELLLAGPGAPRPHALPPLPAGVSPALISHVVLRELGWLERSLVLDLGCAVAPAVPHLRLPAAESAGPARCLSSGRAMDPARVEALLRRGRAWGERLTPAEPLVLAECVPGGTTTALAVLRGLGLPADGLVSGSLRTSAHGLKAELVRRGLAAADLADLPTAASPQRVLAAVGDPMQALATGLLLGAAARGVPLLLAGGSQMAAVLALALALAPPAARARLAAAAPIATTAWVAEEPDSDLQRLLALIGGHWQVRPRLEVAGLRFHHCSSPALQDYERGYVKEGVGAGGLAWLWQRLGRDPLVLAQACDRACALLLAGQRSVPGSVPRVSE
jgi:uncharacterized protein (TIGR00303 family)